VRWIEELERGRVQATRESADHKLPRMVRLAERYELDETSLNLFQLLALSMSVSTVAFGSVLAEYNDDYGE